MSFKNLYYYRQTKKAASPKTIEKDLIIYCATPAGISAAVQGVRAGLSVVIAEFGSNIGGMTTSGLGAADLGATEAVGGISKDFYTEIGNYYGRKEQQKFEPRVAKAVYEKWIKEYQIEVYYNQHLSSVKTKNGKISEIVMEDGTIYKGKIYIDSSYEGDLLAKTGVTYNVGREANSTYKEIYNGIQFGGQHHNFETWIDPYIVEGDKDSGYLLGITNTSLDELGYNGKADESIQAYNFRICLTKDDSNKVSITKPYNYNADRYILLLRYIKAGFWDAMNLHTILPNGKTDLNNFGGFSTDNIGMNYKWPEGNYEMREEIFQDHLSYNMGMLYFLANDSRVPKEIREEVDAWGLPKDEFKETGHWPPQLYIREARRMVSDYVMTDHNCLGHVSVDDSIGLASYQMDSHHCRRVVIDGRCVNEGDVQIPISPYPISYRSIIPKAEECTNLVVPVCVSSSHIAYGSIRMEPVFMILGQSAAIAATLAIKNHVNVQELNYDELKRELLKAGQIVEWDNLIEYDPVEEMKKTFGKKTLKR